MVLLSQRLRPQNENKKLNYYNLCVCVCVFVLSVSLDYMYNIFGVDGRSKLAARTQIR